MVTKVAIIGFGSAGQRHFKALKRIKNLKIYVFSNRKSKSKFFFPYDSITKVNPDYIVISTPTAEHLYFVKFIEKNFKKKIVLVEKPLFKKYTNFIAKKNIFYVGYQLRFHPVIQELKKIIKGEKILNINIICNSYLPKWRKKNYKNSYSSSKLKGGGVLLDLSHELDYLEWIFPNLKYKYIYKKKLSSLKIDSEDICVISGFEKKNKFPFQVNLSYFSKSLKRIIYVDTEKFSFTGNLIENFYEISSLNKKKIRKFKNANSNYLTYLMHKSILEKKENNLSDLKFSKSIMKSISKLNQLSLKLKNY